ncbi:MAG: sugar ABC transporter permease [Firmicutes bacterium]|nr:sugar ABC transporter permease [Bacillota bacterium]
MGTKGRKSRLTLRQKRNSAGYVFVLPFIIGFALFFLWPFAQSIIFSLSELEITREGYDLHFVGFTNYYRALFVNANFLPTFLGQIQSMLISVPSILIFSFFAALLLNGEFKGRWLARVIFFLPVVMGAGIVLQLEKFDYMYDILRAGGFGRGAGIGGADLKLLLYELKLPVVLIEVIVTALEGIPDIIRKSGIQILVFLSGLQSIPAYLYEACEMEGATGWEKFWLITFPLMTPMIITNVVYSIVDSFTAVDNELVRFIHKTAFGGMGYGVGVAMSWMYFAAIGSMLAVVMAIFGRRTYYLD